MVDWSFQNLPHTIHFQMEWKGGMNVTYRYTGSAIFRLVVHSSMAKRKIKDVIATLRGSEEPDRYVLLGNHVDAWVQVRLLSYLSDCVRFLLRGAKTNIKRHSWESKALFFSEAILNDPIGFVRQRFFCFSRCLQLF